MEDETKKFLKILLIGGQSNYFYREIKRALNSMGHEVFEEIVRNMKGMRKRLGH